MLRVFYLAMTILLLPLEPASADAPSDLEANAALKYWRAFPQLPTLTEAEQHKLAAECLTMPLDAREGDGEQGRIRLANDAQWSVAAAMCLGH